MEVRGSGRKVLEGLDGDGIWLLLKRSFWLLPGLIAKWEENMKWRKRCACLCPLLCTPSSLDATSALMLYVTL